MELLSLTSFSRLLSRVPFAFGLLTAVCYWVHPVQLALMPNELACTFIAVYPFLLPTLLAVYGSEACFNLELFASCFLLASASGTCYHPA